MILIADSGSTKTDWVLHDGTAIVLRTTTQGLNPTLQSAEDIYKVLSEELDGKIASDAPDTIYFYGAGCAYETADNRMKEALEQYFVTRDIHIHSDLLAAARALCGHEEGIACILGTGSNSCLFDGEKITDNTPALGYILGDEGSGAHLGRQLVSDCIKKQLPSDLFIRKQEKPGNTDVAEALFYAVFPAQYNDIPTLMVAHTCYRRRGSTFCKRDKRDSRKPWTINRQHCRKPNGRTYRIS